MDPARGRRAFAVILGAFVVTLAVLGHPQAADCNRNGTPDDVDIAAGESLDCDSNGVPDECDVAPTWERLAGPSDYHLPAEPEDLALADFDGDGILDVAISSQAAGSVTVVRGRGDGGFDDPVSIDVAGGLTAIVAVDLNGDGNQDIATCSSFDDLIYVLDGVGDGSFAAPREFTSGNRPEVLVARDFNRDGILDLATGSEFIAVTNFSVLLGDGSGSFGHPLTLSKDPARGCVVADFDGDGLQDLASIMRVSSFKVYMGQEDGTLALSITQATDGLAYDIADADLNGDGAIDLAVACSTSKHILVFHGDGRGGFAYSVTLKLLLEPARLCLTDVSADGIIDVVASSANTLGNDLDLQAVVLGQGAGRFGGPATIGAARA